MTHKRVSCLKERGVEVREGRGSEGWVAFRGAQAVPGLKQ